jgi:hypothetical protein
MAAPVSARSIHEQNAVPAPLYRADPGTGALEVSRRLRKRMSRIALETLHRAAPGIDRVVAAE